MLARAARTQVLRVARAPALRRAMSTVAEGETLSPMSIKHPEVQGAIACTIAIYIGAFRWNYLDRQMEKADAAKATHHAHAEEVRT